MNFALPEQNLQRLAAQINLSGTFNHTVRTPWNGHQVIFSVKVERGLQDTACVIEMGGQRHSVTVRNENPHRHIELADFIDAIANGRVDSAEPAPGRVTRLPVLGDDRNLISSEQISRLRHMVRHGGFTALELGGNQPIHVAIHRRPSIEGNDVILSTGPGRPRTSYQTIRGTENETLRRLLVLVEQLHILTTPRKAA